MVCNRCKIVVEAELKKLGVEISTVELGLVETDTEISDDQKKVIAEMLFNLGFELIIDKKSQLVERIKNLIVELVHHDDNDLKVNLSDFIRQKLDQDYAMLSHLFSEEVETTIEKYFILQKIEKVKELLAYDELNLNQIALKLNYSSVAHLSNQFKKVTGFSPTYYKKFKSANRLELDQI